MSVSAQLRPLTAEFTRTFEWGACADAAAVLLMMALFFWLLATRLEGG